MSGATVHLPASPVFIQKVLRRKIQLFKQGCRCGAKNSMLFELTFKNECVAFEFNSPSNFFPAGLCSDAFLVGLVLFAGKTLAFEANVETCIFASTFGYCCGKSIPVVFPQ